MKSVIEFSEIHTLNTYQEWIQFLKEKPFVCQALFAQHAYHQQKNDKQAQIILLEIQGLLKNIVPLIELVAQRNENIEKQGTVLYMIENLKILLSEMNLLDCWKS